jgi:hypothetical protein
MSRKALKPTFYKETEEEEKKVSKEEKKEISKPDPLGVVPWLNANEVRAQDRNAALGLVAQKGFGIESPGTHSSRHEANTARGPDISAGAAALVSEARHRYIAEERRPGAFRVDGLGYEVGFEDEYTVDEEQATLATNEELTSTFKVIARAVGTENENWRLRERDQAVRERDQAVRERDQLRQIMDNAVVVTPVVTTQRDVENGNEEAAQVTSNDGDLPESDDHKWGTRIRRRYVIGVILLVVVVVAVVLAIVLPTTPDTTTPNTITSDTTTPEPTTKEPSTLEPTTPEQTTPEPPTPEPTTPEPTTPEPTTPPEPNKPYESEAPVSAPIIAPV